MRKLHKTKSFHLEDGPPVDIKGFHIIFFLDAFSI